MIRGMEGLAALTGGLPLKHVVDCVFR